MVKVALVAAAAILGMVFATAYRVHARDTGAREAGGLPMASVTRGGAPVASRPTWSVRAQATVYAVAFTSAASMGLVLLGLAGLILYGWITGP